MSQQQNALTELIRALTQKPPLQLHGVADRNIPGQERIWLRANVPVRLSDYILCVGIALPNQQILPINDHLFWLGDHAVDEATWVVVYTCSGQTRVTKDERTGAPVLVLHWGKAQTVFTIDALVPALMRPVREHMQIGPEGR